MHLHHCKSVSLSYSVGFFVGVSESNVDIKEFIHKGLLQKVSFTSPTLLQISIYKMTGLKPRQSNLQTELESQVYMQGHGH